MRTKWIIHKLNSYTPSWATTTSLYSPFKTLQNPSSSYASAFVLNHVEISRLLSICAREGHPRLGSSIHASIIKTHEFFNPENQPIYRNAVVIWNSLLSAYSKCGDLGGALKVFDDIPVRDTVSWNTMISGVLRTGDVEEGFGYLKRMRELGACGLDQSTFTTVLSACDRPELSVIKKGV
ncbi:hypothetical protein Tsubulata_048628 [Turnera subulata]|uniref:Pentatricopeptide repeat-containing protein n=1 Tax=Turnera subulata TaxID=218843 RepID=A0A9Q0FR06_9ROSI|nr:hypothetical protein Tsubulata_048628 [Turnera subulata]